MIEMLTLFAAISAGVSLLLLGGAIHVYRNAQRVSKNISETLESIFTPITPGEPSIFNQAVNEILEGGAQRVGVHVQAAIKGSIGGTMKGVNAALEKEAIDGNPTLALAGALPKSVKKNPLAMIGLQMLAQKIGNGGGNASSNNGATQAKFTL